jgi:hypothetical protein
LKSHDTLLLEFGAPIVDHSITLRCIPVFGNDPSEKFNPKKCGNRGQQFKAEKTFIINPCEDSVQDVRFSFMEDINSNIDIMQNNTAYSLFEPHTCRLRATNWAEEALDVPLSEFTSDKKPLLLSTVVSTGLLKNGSVLLLEAGNPPIPGMCEFEIALCTRGLRKFFFEINYIFT